MKMEDTFRFKVGLKYIIIEVMKAVIIKSNENKGGHKTVLRRSKYLSIILVLLTALLITACDAENPTDGVQEGAEEETIENYQALEGGTLNLAVTRFTTLNPIFNSNHSLFQLHHLIYDGLVTFDENMDIAPQLAKDWDVADDGQSIRFYLRDDVAWHDGEAFSAEDVIFTIDLIKGNIREANHPSIFRTSVGQISDAREIEEGVLNITFTRPFSSGLEVMSFPILPKHIFEGRDIEKINTDEFPMVGTGAFKLEVYEAMRNISLVRNDNYWGQKPYIEKVEVEIVPDSEAQLSIFESHEIDFAQPTSIDWGKYTKDNTVKVYEYVSNSYEFLGVNFKNPILQDVNVRRAMAYAIDRHRLISNIYLRHATVVDVPIYPLSSIYDEGSQIYGYSLEEANNLLDTANYAMNEASSIRATENGTPLKFRLIANEENILREKTAYFLQEALAEIGIEIEVQLLGWEAFNEAVEAGNFDILLGGWDLSYIPDLSFAFHSSQRDRTNFINYADETMDQLLVDAFRAPNHEAKQARYSELQQHIAEELPYISLFFSNGAIAVRDEIKGEFKPNHYNLFNGIESWFINYEIIEE
ncbi:MAG: peptide ABC transporter substrate-binding protein [Clostridiaceae bacterium]|nr:peptide ABC transporter substrate-binding protein [Clostridiaceae bacterium]